MKPIRLSAALLLLTLAACTTVTTRVTDPATGAVTETTTTTVDPASVQAVALTAAAFAPPRGSVVREEKSAGADPRELPISRDEIDRRFRPAAAAK